MTNKEITNAYYGSDQVEKIYLGSDVIWPAQEPEPVYSAMPLTFEILTGGTIYLKKRENADGVTYEYKTYNSKSDYLNNAFADAASGYGQGYWTMLPCTGEPSAQSTISVQPGQYVAVRANKGTTPWARQSGSAYSNMFSGTALYNLMGNIMSLNYPTPTDYIPWTTNSSFSGDSYIYSFANIFFGANVVSARYLILPDYVPRNGFSQLFYSNHYLVETPHLAQADLNIYCYFGMFGDCTSLTTAPELTATTLPNYCYQNMFKGCTSLTTAPVLPATSLMTGCYNNMFSGCTSLNYVKCLAIYNPNSTMNWLAGVSPTGTFVKNPNTTWQSGASGIPTGWTVEDAT